MFANRPVRQRSGSRADRVWKVLLQVNFVRARAGEAFGDRHDVGIVDARVHLEEQAPVLGPARSVCTSANQ